MLFNSCITFGLGIQILDCTDSVMCHLIWQMVSSQCTVILCPLKCHTYHLHQFGAVRAFVLSEPRPTKPQLHCIELQVDEPFAQGSLWRLLFCPWYGYWGKTIRTFAKWIPLMVTGFKMIQVRRVWYRNVLQETLLTG